MTSGAPTLQQVRGVALDWVDLSTGPDNRAAQRAIERNGGVLAERFTKPAAGGDAKPGLRHRIRLDAS